MSTILYTPEELARWITCAVASGAADYKTALGIATEATGSNARAYSERYAEPVPYDAMSFTDELEKLSLDLLAKPQDWQKYCLLGLAYNCAEDETAAGQSLRDRLEPIETHARKWLDAIHAKAKRAAEDDEAFQDVGPLPLLTAEEIKERAKGFDRVIYASFHVSECDSMTDYFHGRTVRRVVIGFGKGKRENFQQLRKAAGLFPPTAHLGPNCGQFFVWVNREKPTEHGYCPATKEGGTFLTQEAAEKWIQAEIALAETPGANYTQAGAAASGYGYSIRSEEIEHRETYSMGHGNYLGHSRYSGWQVSSSFVEYFRGDGKDEFFEPPQTAGQPDKKRRAKSPAVVETPAQPAGEKCEEQETPTANNPAGDAEQIATQPQGTPSGNFSEGSPAVLSVGTVIEATGHRWQITEIGRVYYGVRCLTSSKAGAVVTQIKREAAHKELTAGTAKVIETPHEDTEEHNPPDSSDSGKQWTNAGSVSTPEQTAPTAESGSSLPPSVDFSDENDTVEDFAGKERAVIEFGKELEANRIAIIQGVQYMIDTMPDRSGFRIVITNAEGYSENIVSGFYGYAFDTFDRTVSYAVSKARSRFVCHPETFQNGCQIEKRYHNRRAVFVYLVTLPEPVKGSKFDKLETQAKRFGGWYAREYRPEYQRGGFMFTDKRQADRFAKDFTPSAKVATMRHNATPEPAPAQETPSGDFSDVEPSTEYAQRISRNVDHIARMSTAARLEELADGMQKTIDEKTRPMTQNWTRKRGEEYAHRMHDGENLERCQKALRVLAAHWRAGTVPESLRPIRTKTAVLKMVSEYRERENSRPMQEHERYHDKTPLAIVLRAFIAQGTTPEDSEAVAQRERRKAIEAAEQRLRVCDVAGFFPTPKQAAVRVLNAAQIPENPPADFSILEPSCGIGSLLELVADLHPELVPQIDCIETWSAAADVTELKGFGPVHRTDFLEVDSFDWGRKYDRILMNPPFEDLQGIDHVKHAFNFLKPGGRLVAILPDGYFQTSASRRKVQDFQLFVDDLNGETFPLANAFTGADAFRQTGVSVRVLILDAPE